jgi:hypothetical protein
MGLKLEDFTDDPEKTCWTHFVASVPAQSMIPLPRRGHL